MSVPTATITLHRRRAGKLTRLGDWLARHRRTILALQWLIVLFYVLLVAVPAFLPYPHPEARLFANDFGAALVVDASAAGDGGTRAMAPYVAAWHERLVLLAQYLFWGIWWPFVIVSILAFGRVWCGLLCPEGALAEFASRRGRGGPIPKWIRWGGWPVLAFIVTTIYGQLISVYEYPQAALLILGGSTLAAVLVGWFYGKGKRVWCRYLCPVTGVFALLARLSPLHFRVDRQAWNDFPQRTGAVDCPTLLNIKHLKSAAQCHACGRCSGHRDAVGLALRSPNAEILGGEVPRTAEAVLLLFGLLGVAIGAFQWTVSPWFVAAKIAAATWLVDHDILWPLADSPAWWLLTRHPEAGDVFTWLDGAAILGYIGTVALLLGGFAFAALALAARLARLDWRALALGLTPLAGAGLFLGLSMMTATHLRAEGVLLPWLDAARAAILAAGALWSAYLGLRFFLAARPGLWRGASALAVYVLPLLLTGGSWILVFYLW